MTGDYCIVSKRVKIIEVFDLQSVRYAEVQAAVMEIYSLEILLKLANWQFDPI